MLAPDVAYHVPDRCLGALRMTAMLAFFAGPVGRWIIIAGLLASVATAAYWRAYNAGYAVHEAETSAEIAEANQRARKAESDAVLRMSQLAERHYKEETHANAEVARLRADYRNGTRRLSVPVEARVPSCEDTASASGTGGETRAELDPATAEALVAIAAEGDSAIRQSNALIDAYQIAATVCGQ